MGVEKYRKTAYVNFMIIAVNVLWFLFLETRGSTENTEFMIFHGALFEPAVLYHKEYWRLVTAVFMHFGIQHLVNNMLLLFVLGDNLERALGKVKYAVFYLVCGVGANVASMCVNLMEGSYAVSAGASGAIFGVVGGLLLCGGRQQRASGGLKHKTAGHSGGVLPVSRIYQQRSQQCGSCGRPFAGGGYGSGSVPKAKK